MHGAAMTHLIWAKENAVAIEIFSGALLEQRHFQGLWFFARYLPRTYGKIFLPVGPRRRRSAVNESEAARVVRCATESSFPRRARPSCDAIPRKGVSRD